MAAKKRAAKGDARAKMTSLFVSEDDVEAFKAAGYIPVLRWVKGFAARTYKSDEVRAHILRATASDSRLRRDKPGGVTASDPKARQ